MGVLCYARACVCGSSGCTRARRREAKGRALTRLDSTRQEFVDCLSEAHLITSHTVCLKYASARAIASSHRIARVRSDPSESTLCKSSDSSHPISSHLNSSLSAVSTELRSDVAEQSTTGVRANPIRSDQIR